MIKVQDQLILVLEDMNGEPFRKYLANKSLDLSIFFKIALQLVEALGELHLQQIIHKDINPNNIIINSQTLSIKLINFGYASQLLQEMQDYDSLNLEGTIAYISPEQTGRTNRSIDYRSDFYSLGVTFYEMLTGRLPYQSTDPLEMVYCHLTMLPEKMTVSNPKIPSMIENIVFKLMAKTPEKRYNSTAGIKADLIQCQMQWDNENQITEFHLGLSDVQEQLMISQKLYGREEQINTLMDCFARTCQGGNHLVFVSGYSGIGKTSLIKEIIKLIVNKQGFFLSGKFDQLQRSIPYSAIIEAFSDFVNHCMTESEARFSQLQRDLTTAIGSNGQVIVNLIPNLELIIGKQPPVPNLPHLATQSRLLETFKSFVQAVAKADHPLVLFLDDLQWIDNASLQLINLIFTGDNLKNFLLIGAFRENEVDGNHPLTIMQQQFTKENISFTHLLLQPLEKNDIENLLKDSFLVAEQEKLREFADLLLEKTNGNPFFINEFLKEIYYDKLLKFSYKELCWTWDLEKLRQLSITENVIDLLITRIYRLPTHAQQLLELAACIGHTFDLWTLSVISQKSLEETAQYVLEATKASFIVPIHGNYRLLEGVTTRNDVSMTTAKNIRYRFIHDKVQQAAYCLIPEETRRHMHLRIGRLLLEENEIDEKQDNFFDILNHFNYTLDLISNIEEKKRLANYNLWGGKKAKVSSAYQAAITYFMSGLRLIADIDCHDKGSLRFSLIKELATCQYLIGEYENAELNFKQLLESAKETLSTIEVYKLHCEMLSTLNRHEEAIQLGLKVLASVNIKIPKKPNLRHILLAIIKIKILIGRKDIRHVMLPPMKSKEYQAITGLISQLLNSAFITNQNLFVMFSCINVKLSLRYGYTESTGFTCLAYAFIVMHGLHWYQEGMKFFELYQRLSEHYPQGVFSGRNYFVQGCFVDPWRVPLADTIDILNKSYHELYNAGDLVYSNYCNLTINFHTSMMGKPLSELKIYVQNSIEFIKKTKAKDFDELSMFWSFFVSSLENYADLNKEELQKYAEKIRAGNNKTELCFFYSMATKLCYMLGNFAGATDYGACYVKLSQYMLGLVSQVEGNFYYALSLLATAKNNSHLNRKYIAKTRTELKRCSSWCPANYKHYLFLLDAEIARIKKRIPEAIQYYMQAIKLAESQNALNIAAIAYEAFGRFYLQLDAQDVAKLYYTNAYNIWLSLGALAKIHAFEKAHPQWFPARLSDQENNNAMDFSSLPSLDIVSLMRSTQTISGEIELDKLLHKLLIILLQNAGATRGLLLVKEDNDWYVEAEGSIAEQRISLAHVENINKRTDISLSLILYVQRTKQPLLIQTPEEIDSFAAKDDYLLTTKPQSIMVVPILFRDQLQNILYLENRTNSMAFKTEHTHILQILSSQAAISLQNARLYYQATHDSLTGLCNRNFLYQMFNLGISKVKNSRTGLAVLLLDLDFFKQINDTLGHQFGDKLLIHTATLIKYCFKQEDVAARLGGDEFVVMIEYDDIKEVTEAVEKFLNQLNQVVLIDGHEITITSSIGISLYPDDSQNIAELLKQADTALYRVKESGKNGFQFYTSSLDHIVKQENKMVVELREALRNNELHVYYQPVFLARSHKISYFEALIRWQHKEQGLIPAKSFISVAEKTGLIIQLGKWVLNTVLKEIKLWQKNNLTPLPVAVNISGLQFKMQSINQLVAEALLENQIDTKYLQLEFTESVSIEYTEKVLADIANLKALGIKLTLDDFGTYYSSLSYLRENFVDKIKIDQSFVKGINNCKTDSDLIVAIIQLAHSLGLKVVAEGVENEEQLMFLEAHGIDELQGYFLSEPITDKECVKLLTECAPMTVD